MEINQDFTNSPEWKELSVRYTELIKQALDIWILTNGIARDNGYTIKSFATGFELKLSETVEQERIHRIRAEHGVY